MVHLTGDQRKDAEEAVGAEFFRHKTLPLSNISVSHFHQSRWNGAMMCSENWLMRQIT